MKIGFAIFVIAYLFVSGFMIITMDPDIMRAIENMYANPDCIPQDIMQR